MELYWILRLPHLHQIFEVIGVLSLLLSGSTIILFASSLKEDFPEEKHLKYAMVWLPLISFFSFCIAALIPDKSDLALMMGWDALKSENVQEVIEILKDKIK